MKKILIIILIILTIYLIPKEETKNILIPQEAIRFRVIANSDSKDDQNIKIKVRDSLNKELSQILKSSSSYEESRNLIQNNQEQIKNNVKNTLAANNTNQNYNVNYGLNYFPEKTFKGVDYKAGNYESLVVTLGQGNGKNWWCVLFPPLCLLEADENNTEDVEYQFFVKK